MFGYPITPVCQYPKLQFVNTQNSSLSTILIQKGYAQNNKNGNVSPLYLVLLPYISRSRQAWHCSHLVCYLIGSLNQCFMRSIYHMLFKKNKNIFNSSEFNKICFEMVKELFDVYTLFSLDPNQCTHINIF